MAYSLIPDVEYPWVGLILSFGIIALIMGLVREFVGLISCLNDLEEGILSITITAFAVNLH